MIRQSKVRRLKIFHPVSISSCLQIMKFIVLDYNSYRCEVSCMKTDVNLLVSFFQSYTHRSVVFLFSPVLLPFFFPEIRN